MRARKDFYKRQAQRVALDWMGPFHDAIKPVVEKLYHSVTTGNEAQISIDSNSKPDYREKLEEELKALREDVYKRQINWKC